MFEQGIDLIAKVVTALGTLWCAWGAVTFGMALKDKTGPEIKQSIGTIAGGAMVILAAQLIRSVSLG